jgi:hypothetical protein
MTPTTDLILCEAETSPLRQGLPTWLRLAIHNAPGGPVCSRLAFEW